MSSDSTERLASRLQPGETIIWSGRPDPALIARRAAPGLIMSLVIIAVLLTLAAPELRRAPDLAHVWTILSTTRLGLIGGGFAALFVLGLIGRVWIATRTAYAVTDRRALILRVGRLWDYPPDSLPGVSVYRRVGGSVDVVFIPQQTVTPGRPFALRTAPHPPTRGRNIRGQVPDGFRTLGDFGTAQAAEAALLRLLDARARDLAATPAVALAPDAAGIDTAGGDTAFRTVTHPQLGFAIDVPPGTVTFNTVGQPPPEWQWNFLDIADRDDGPRIFVQIDAAPPGEAEAMRARLGAAPALDAGGPSRVVRGPAIDGAESFASEAAVAGVVRLRQVLLYRDGWRYLIKGGGSFATAAADALFRRVVGSVRFTTATSAPPAVAVEPGPPVAAPVDRAGLGRFVALVLLGLGSLYLGLWLLAVVAVVLLWRNRFASARVRTAIAVAIALPHVVVAVCRHFLPPGVIEVEPVTLATSAQAWFAPALSLALGACLIWAGQFLARGRTVAIGSIPTGQLSGRSARAVMIAFAAALAAFGVLASLNLRDDFERVEIAPNGNWRLVHTVWGTVADIPRGAVRSVSSNREIASPGASRNDNRDDWRVVVSLADGRSFAVRTSNPHAPEAAAALQARR